MLKRILAGLLAMLLLCVPALAEVYQGSTVAGQEIPLAAGSSGILQELNALPGQIVSNGEMLGEIASTKVFAGQDGTIARIHESGDTILELAPVERYLIYCTVEDEAYQSASATLVRPGERVYISCTKNGTHRAVGVIAQVDGNAYRVLTIGGELYVGETVYIFRDEAFSYNRRIGVGTVVNNAVEAYSISGELVRLHVQPGEEVQRGELLFEYAETADLSLSAPVSGIISEVLAAPGDAVQKDQALLNIVPQSAVQVEILVDESASSALQPGTSVQLGFADTAETEVYNGTVISAAFIPENGLYALRIDPEREDLRLGMSVEVRTAE